MALTTGQASDGAPPLAVVTGASSGIGKAFAHELSARGYRLLLISRDRDALDAVAAELPGPAAILPADLTVAGDVDRVEARLHEQPPELLVNNAGTGRWGTFADDRPSPDGAGDPLVDTVAVNVLAVARLARAVLPGFVAADRGGIITVSSPAAARPAPMIAVYAATKAFVDSLDASLRVELAAAGATGITITTVWPSWTRTRFHDRLAQDVSDVPPQDWTTPDVVARRAVDAHLHGVATLHVPEPTRSQRVRERARRARRDLRSLRSRLPEPLKVAGRRARTALRRAVRPAERGL